MRSCVTRGGVGGQCPDTDSAPASPAAELGGGELDMITGIRRANHHAAARRRPVPTRGGVPRAGAVGPVLAALLLAIMALLGGAPTAGGAAPPAPGSSSFSFSSSSAFSSPVSGPESAATDVSGPRAGDQPAHGWWTEAVPASVPRAGLDRPHAPNPSPPPGHGALRPRPPGLRAPVGVAPGAAGAGRSATARIRAALPGVRGPPGTAAGPPALHRSRSTDLASRPSRPL